MAASQFTVKSRDILMSAPCDDKWWSTLKSAVFGSSLDSSLPLIGRGGGGGKVCQSVGKAEMLSANFDGKHLRDPVDLPSISQSQYLCLQVTGGEGGSCWILIPMPALTYWVCFIFF